MANLQCDMTKEGILSNLQIGLGYEKRARDLCAELLPLVDRAEDQEALKRIISDEERHIKITAGLIAIVNEHYLGSGTKVVSKN